MTIAMIASASTRTTSAPRTPTDTGTRSRRTAGAVRGGLATTARFAGHFVVACASVAVLGAESEY